MTENETITQLKEAGMQMYTALTMMNALHHEVEVEDAILCAHCSALADAKVYYPCPTVEILLTDYMATESDASQPEESLEPASSE